MQKCRNYVERDGEELLLSTNGTYHWWSYLRQCAGCQSPTRLKIDMNISPHIGRYPQTPAPVCSHYHYSMLSKILSKHCGLWSPLSSLHIDAGRVLSGLVIVTDEAPVLGWGGPGPGNDIMTGWPCTHHTSHPGIITRISHTQLSRHLVHATHHHRQFWIPLNTHWTPLENRRLFPAWLTRREEMQAHDKNESLPLNCFFCDHMMCLWSVQARTTFSPPTPAHGPGMRRGRHLASIWRCPG